MSGGISAHDLAIIEGCSKAAGELTARVHKELADEIKSLREEVSELRSEIDRLKSPALRAVA